MNTTTLSDFRGTHHNFLIRTLNPLDQFEIIDLVSLETLPSLHLSLTNIGLYLTIGAFFL